MRISRVVPQFDYARLSSKYQVFILRSSKGRLGYADEAFDRLASEATVVSVAFMGGGEAWVMTRRQRDAPGVVRAVLAGRGDMAFQEERSLARVGDRALLQLCLHAVSGDGGLDGASNVCGRLVVASLGKPNTEYFGGTADPCAIHALEVGVTPRMELELNIKTFTSCAARRFKRTAPRFELVDGRYLRRVPSFSEPDDRSLFCQGARFEGDRYGGFALMDASDQDSFSRSKLGVLRSVLACMDYLFDGAVRVDFEEAEDVTRIDCSASKLGDRLSLVAGRISRETLCVCDATSELGEQAKLVAETVHELFGITAEVVDADVADAATIRLVHARDTYVEGDVDPYGSSVGFAAVQHMTPESGFTRTSIAVAVKELAIKLDIADGRLSLMPWEWGSWEFAVRSDAGGSESFAFLNIGEDGTTLFEGPASAISAMAGHSSLVQALLLDAGCEFAVRGPEGDVNVVSRTELFGVPNFERVWRDLVERREDRRERPNGRPMRHAIGRGKADRELYFADAVDIASCSTSDGRRYYRVGMRGYGMQFGATHKASVLREVISVGESRSLVDDMLPMLDVDMVRWGQPTVLPFPVKYLREWLEMRKAVR